MKNYLRLSIPVFFIFGVFIILSERIKDKKSQMEGQALHCFINASTARVLGEVFVLSNPWNDPNQLTSYIRENPKTFEPNSNLITSMKSLGLWLTTNDKNFIEQKCKAHLNKIIDEQSLAPDYSHQLVNDFKAGNINCYALGEELIWLSAALPRLLEGSLLNYLESASTHRQELEKLITIYSSMNNSDPEIDEIISQNVNCHDQKIKDQIYLMALLSNK